MREKAENIVDTEMQAEDEDEGSFALTNVQQINHMYCKVNGTIFALSVN